MKSHSFFYIAREQCTTEEELDNVVFAVYCSILSGLPTTPNSTKIAIGFCDDPGSDRWGPIIGNDYCWSTFSAEEVIMALNATMPKERTENTHYIFIFDSFCFSELGQQKELIKSDVFTSLCYNHRNLGVWVLLVNRTPIKSFADQPIIATRKSGINYPLLWTDELRLLQEGKTIVNIEDGKLIEGDGEPTFFWSSKLTPNNVRISTSLCNVNPFRRGF